MMKPLPFCYLVLTAMCGYSTGQDCTESTQTQPVPGDIVFLLDGSGSVQANQFLAMKNFVKEATKSLLPYNTSFAFAQYSGDVTYHIQFNQFRKATFDSQVDGIIQRTGGTYTAWAIDNVVKYVFDSTVGARAGAKRFLIVITDGQSSDAGNYPSAIANADAKNIIRYAIGVGGAFSSQAAQYELKAIASRPESGHVFNAEDFQALDPIKSALEMKILTEQGLMSNCSYIGYQTCSLTSAPQLTTTQVAADVVFLLDGSGSVSSDQFLLMKTFVKNVTGSLLPYDTLFAYAQYSGKVTKHVNFNQFNVSGWESQVDSISQRGGGTNTAYAIGIVVSDMFDSFAGARPHAKRILIIITDGKADDASKYPGVTAQADGKQIIRYAVGVGSAWTSTTAQAQLNAIASQPESDHVFRVDSFDALMNITNTLQQKVLTIQGVSQTCFPSQGIPTINGNSGGAVCVFPFRFKGRLHSQCITMIRNVPWCSTTPNYDQDEKWGECTGMTCSLAAISQHAGLPSQEAADIVFLLDGSGSVSANQFSVMKEFVKNVTRRLMQYDTAFAYAQYSDWMTKHVNFNQFHRARWEIQVNSITQRRGGTYTAYAIGKVVNDMFDSSVGARPYAKGILIVITDGESYDASKYPSVTAEANAKKITIYAIGVGDAWQKPSAMDQLKAMATKPESEHVFTVDRFEALNHISNTLQTKILTVQGVQGASTTTCLPTHTHLTIHTSQGIPTINGNAGGAVCVFPFVYVGTKYWHCISTNHDKRWCATTGNFDWDGKWGECTGHPTVNGNAGGAVCVFPFVYLGSLHWKCTTINHNTPWCSTTDSYDRDGKWGECTSLGVTRTCPLSPPRQYQSTANSVSADIVFLLDGSGSVSAAQFSTMKTFVKNVTRTLLSYDFLFAYAQYSDDITKHVNFHQFNATGFASQVDNISQRGGGKYTAWAIRKVVEDMFHFSAGTRSGASKILIIITDGQTSDAISIPSVAGLADANQITRYAVGVGSAWANQAALNELNAIASKPVAYHAYAVDSFEALTNITKTLQKEILINQGGVTPVCTNRVPEVHVLCTSTTMSVALEKSAVLQLHADRLRLSDPFCTLTSNATHVLINIPLTDCGTRVEDDGQNIIFRNEVVSFDDPTDVVTRRYDVEMEIICKFPKKGGSATVNFGSHQPALTFEERGFGTFTYQFEFFQSPNFLQLIDPNTYPVEYNLGDMIYMQIDSVTSVGNSELFVESCIATPTNTPNHTMSYTLISNGCQMDSTVQMYSSPPSKVRLGFQAFKFIGAYDQVYITCSVIMCKPGEPGTRCSQGCIAGSPTNKRETHLQTSQHYISQGPLRLRRNVNHTEAQSTVDMNLVYAVVGFLAIVASVCGVAIYRVDTMAPPTI